MSFPLWKRVKSKEGDRHANDNNNVILPANGISKKHSGTAEEGQLFLAWGVFPRALHLNNLFPFSL